MRRREFDRMTQPALLHIARSVLVAALAAAWLGEARAQPQPLPVIAYVNGGVPEPSAPYVAAFRAAALRRCH